MEKLIVRFWVVCLAYFVIGYSYILASQNLKIIPVFMGIYMVAFGISIFTFLPVAWRAYRLKGIPKPTAISLTTFLFFAAVMIICFGFLIGSNGSVGTVFLVRSISITGIFIVSYGMIGLISGELLLAIPGIKLVMLAKGLKARIAGTFYILFGSLGFFYFLFGI